MNVLQWGKGLLGRWARAGRPYGTGLIKWCALGVAMGLLGGAVGSAFHHCVDEATALRTAHPWLLAGLPLAGLAIVGLYALAGYRESHPGTNLVLECGRSGEPEPLRLAPLIFLSTALTHLCGGSSGREGAALQLGGSMGSALGRALHLNREDEKTMILTGMSAVFSALFGTPLAAAVFCIEVADVGLLAEASLLPCLVSALTAFWTAGRLAVAPTRFAVTAPALFQPQDAVRVLVLAIGCALVSQLFCWAMHTAEHAYRRALPNYALRTAAGGCLVIFRPTSSRNIMRVHLLPKLERAGTSAWSKSRQPRIRLSGWSSSACIHLRMHAGVCWPSESAVTQPGASGQVSRQ